MAKAVDSADEGRDPDALFRRGGMAAESGRYAAAQVQAGINPGPICRQPESKEQTGRYRTGRYMTTNKEGALGLGTLGTFFGFRHLPA